MNERKSDDRLRLYRVAVDVQTRELVRITSKNKHELMDNKPSPIKEGLLTVVEYKESLTCFLVDFDNITEVKCVTSGERTRIIELYDVRTNITNLAELVNEIGLKPYAVIINEATNTMEGYRFVKNIHFL